MSIIELEIKSFKFVFKFEFSRRINLIKGNSGVGKSTFYELLDRAVNRLDSDVLVNSTYNVVPFSRSLFTTLQSEVSDTIYVIDDLDLINDKQFNELLSKRVDNNLWFIIMSREDVELKTTLTFSTQSLFKLVNDGGTNYWLEPLFSFNKSSDAYYDFVIIEDEKGGYQFFSKLFGTTSNIVSSKGEGNIIRCTLSAVKQGFKSILVIFDNASFGCRYEEFYNRFKNCKVNIEIISQYECFEELLARINLLNQLKEIKYSLDNIEVEANKFISWERFFEYLVQLRSRRVSNI